MSTTLNYFEQIRPIWQEYFETKDQFMGMSRTQREELLAPYRAQLIQDQQEIENEIRKTKKPISKAQIRADLASIDYSILSRKAKMNSKKWW